MSVVRREPGPLLLFQKALGLLATHRELPLDGDGQKPSRPPGRDGAR